MTPFSIPTAYLIVGAMYVLMPAAAWIVLFGLRSRSALLWCSGGGLFGLGVMLLGFRSHIPEWASYPLANSLMFLANMMRAQALRYELEVPWRGRNIALASMGFGLVYEYFHAVLENEILRFEWTTFCLVGLLTHIALLSRQMARQEPSRSAYWVAGGYGVTAVMLLVRMLAVWIGTSAPDAVLGGLDVLGTIVAALATSVIGSVGFIGIFLERARRNDWAAVAARAKQEESARLGAQIAQLDRQRSLGEMSASLGHELNQPLTAILVDAQVAQHGLAQGRWSTAQLGELLHDIEKNTRRASQIIERIRRFIRPTPEQRRPVDLGQLAHEVAQLVSSEARAYRAQIHFATSPAGVCVLGDHLQLSQIVLNVYRNALQALVQSPEREVWVEIERQGPWATLRVRDSGPGLSPLGLQQAGSPFFTPKADGLGVGLSISKSIAQHHGGGLTLANGDAGGAVVELRLPALPAAAA